MYPALLLLLILLSFFLDVAPVFFGNSIFFPPSDISRLRQKSKPSDSPTIPGRPFDGSGLSKVSPFAIPREARFVAVANFAHEGGDGGRGKTKKMRRGKLSGSGL